MGGGGAARRWREVRVAAPGAAEEPFHRREQRVERVAPPLRVEHPNRTAVPVARPDILRERQSSGGPVERDAARALPVVPGDVDVGTVPEILRTEQCVHGIEREEAAIVVMEGAFYDHWSCLPVQRKEVIEVEGAE